MFEVIADQNRPIARFSVQNGKPEIFSKIRESPRVLRDLAFSLTLHICQSLMQVPEFSVILEKYSKFVVREGERNPNFKFWNTYIEMVQHLLHFVRSTRQGNWNPHVFNQVHITMDVCI